MEGVARQNMDRVNEQQLQGELQAAEAVPPVASVSARVGQPPEADPEERPLPALARLNAQELAPYACNHCKDYVRGGVITVCGHLFCWACLWPLLADEPSPKCPRCRIALILHEDIVPFYGEGPNAQPEDGTVLADPGAVPRPAGIRQNNHQQLRGEELRVLEALLAENHIFAPRPPPTVVLCPRIEIAVGCLKWLQVGCAVLIILIWCFVSLT